MFDFKKYLQDKIDEENGEYKVFSERNLDSAFDGDVIVSAKSGKYYRSSAEIPYQIQIVSSDPDSALTFFTKLFKKLHNTLFSQIIDEEMCNITQYYQTPTIVNADIQFGSDHLVEIVTFASFFITYNVSDIQEISIDNEIIEFENASINYTTELHSVKKSGKINVGSRIKTNTTSIAFQMVNKNTVFCNKLFQIAFHKLDANNLFQVKIKMSNGYVGTLNMIISQNSINAAKNALTGANIALIEYDEGNE